MIRDETRQTIRVLAAAYPPLTISEDTVGVWHQAMSGYDPGLALDVAVNWIETEPRFPTIKGFLDHLDAARREIRALERGTGGRPEAEPPEVLRERAAKGMRLMADALRSGSRFDPDEFMAQAEAEGVIAPGTSTVGCLECRGERWVNEGVGGEERRRPCSRCQPDHWTLWKGGHFDPGHYPCEVCRPSRNKRRKDNDD